MRGDKRVHARRGPAGRRRPRPDPATDAGAPVRHHPPHGAAPTGRSSCSGNRAAAGPAAPLHPWPRCRTARRPGRPRRPTGEPVLERKQLKDRTQVTFVLPADAPAGPVSVVGGLQPLEPRRPPPQPARRRHPRRHRRPAPAHQPRLPLPRRRRLLVRRRKRRPPRRHQQPPQHLTAAAERAARKAAGAGQTPGIPAWSGGRPRAPNQSPAVADGGYGWSRSAVRGPAPRALRPTPPPARGADRDGLQPRGG